MEVENIDEKLVLKICNELKLHYHFSNYFVIKNKDGIESIFCYAGSDIINADNICSIMNQEDKTAEYYFSQEVTEIS
ncbi:MAG: hypothetical protein PHS93_08035 [Candidatus Omnitrophica bacterium]|nr:hypothetical protein [Candidatus Omnitrophota bacterium]MDD5353092.1 hypothetical protein [Candidatus Omnitrophota bacterium]